MAKKNKAMPLEVKRTKIPMAVRLSLLMEAGYRCGNPTCPHIITLDLHHIEYVSEGGSDDPRNLISLCPYCHSLHHAGQIPVEAIRHWKGMLLALNQAFDRGSMDLLLFLWQTREQEIWYSGDALLKFSSLIASGLVSFKTQKLYGQTPGSTGEQHGIPILFHPASYEIGMVVELELTKPGRLLVEAWREGNEDQYRRIVSSPPGQEPTQSTDE